MLVSIVILTTGKAERVLEDLRNQTYQDFEVILAQERGIVKSMNCALERASGTIFVRIDDDVRIPPRWLSELLTMFKNDSVGGVTGPTFVPLAYRQNRDSIRWAERPNFFLKWLYDNGEFRPGGIRKCGCPSYDSNFEERFEWVGKSRTYGFDPNNYEPDHLEGTNWAVRTELIRQVGGFDPVFDGVAEWFDDDVVFKIKKLGYKIKYNPNAFLYHLLEKGEHFPERFEGWGRLKNFLRFHIRHGKFHWKMIVYLICWSLYFLTRQGSARLGKAGQGPARQGF